MYKRTQVLAMLVVTLFCATGLVAQTPQRSVVGPGERIRVTTGSDRLEGVLVTVDDDVITVRTRERDVTIRRAAITRLERTNGQRSRARYAGFGALIGLGSGALAGWAAFRCESEGPFCFQALGAGASALVGAAGGAAIGALLPPAPRWVEVERAALVQTFQPAIPPALSPPSTRRWTVAFGMGTTRGGPTGDIEAAMRTAGFGDTVPAFIFPASPSPESHRDVGSYWLDTHYEVRPGWNLGVSFDNTKIARTSGYHFPSQYLYIQDSMIAVTAVVSRTVGPASAGVGPIWYSARANTDDGESTNHSRLGIAVKGGLKFPPQTRVYVDFNVQYRYMGRVTIGPFHPPALFESTPIQFPETEARFSHWFIAIGPGFRF